MIDDIIFNVTSNLQKTENFNHKDILYVKMLLELELSKCDINSKDKKELTTNVDSSYHIIEQYFLSMKLNGCTNSSIKSYQYEIKNMLLFVNKGIENIEEIDLKMYMANGKLKKYWKDKTYNTKMIIIKNFFKWSYEEDFILNNPAKKLKKTKIEKTMGNILTDEQRELFRCACKTERELALCDLLYFSGIRVSELCGLNIDDINLNEKEMIVYGKGRRERYCDFNAQTKVHIKKYLSTREDDNQSLFISKKSKKRLTSDSVRFILRNIKQRVPELKNVNITPHVFRRTLGTDMINKGAPLELVAEKLGHVQVDTTRQCYAKISRTTNKQFQNNYS